MGDAEDQLPVRHYAGGRRRWAVLVFDARAALWASREEWHPEQQGAWLADGSYEMRLPYVDDTELVMDLLRQGEQVKVLEPPALVQAVRARLLAASANYAVVDSAAATSGVSTGPRPLKRSSAR